MEPFIEFEAQFRKLAFQSFYFTNWKSITQTSLKSILIYSDILSLFLIGLYSAYIRAAINKISDNVVWSKSPKVLQVHDVCIQDALAADRPVWSQMQEWLWLLRQPTVARVLLQMSPGADAKTETSRWVIILNVPRYVVPCDCLGTQVHTWTYGNDWVIPSKKYNSWKTQLRIVEPHPIHFIQNNICK